MPKNHILRTIDTASWFIGYDIDDDIPRFSTLAKNYTRRFKDSDIFEKIFTHTQCNSKSYFRR